MRAIKTILLISNVIAASCFRFVKPPPSTSLHSIGYTHKTSQQVGFSILSLRSKYSIRNLFETDNHGGEGSESRSLGEDGFLVDESMMADIEEGQPSQWMVMKDLLGINIFTYFLAAAIAFFLSMNAFLGPGWLGNSIGVQNTGTFTQTSESLPEAVDLSKSEFRF